ncbi:MAG: hypothetical protein ACE5JM_11170, partial [Armatimonadota bacterium]
MARMDLPSRIPLLRNNPVFILEARRIWGQAGMPVLLVLFVGLPGLLGVLVWQDHAVDAGWLPRGGLLPLLLAPGAVLSRRFLLDLVLIADGCIAGCMMAAWVVAAFWIPGVVAGMASHDREQGLLDAMIAAGVRASTIIGGKMIVASLPLALVSLPVALRWGAPSDTGEIAWRAAAFFIVCSLGGPLTAGAVSICFSVMVRRRLVAVPLACITAALVVWGPVGLLFIS